METYNELNGVDNHFGNNNLGGAVIYAQKSMKYEREGNKFWKWHQVIITIETA